MKCTAIITSNKPIILQGEIVSTYVCNGEMIEVGDNYDTDSEYKLPFKLYQCEICKTIKLV